MRKWNLVTAGLALCVNLLASLAALSEDGEVSVSRDANALETPAMTSWEAVAPAETAPPELAMTVETISDLAPEPLLTLEPERIPRYAGVSMSEDERWELAAIIFLESANQCAEGQQAVAEVVLNRVISPDFPDTVYDVLHEGEDTAIPQFSTIVKLDSAEPLATQYAAIDAALYGPSILPEDVVFFSRSGENDRVWGKIQDHVFCYAYIWE